MTESKNWETELRRFSEDGFKNLRRPGDKPAELSMNVAWAVGRQADRKKIPVEDLKKWLQVTYGAVWVKQSGLNPGVDLKDVSAMILLGYKNDIAGNRKLRKKLGLK